MIYLLLLLIKPFSLASPPKTYQRQGFYFHFVEDGFDRIERIQIKDIFGQDFSVRDLNVVHFTRQIIPKNTYSNTICLPDNRKLKPETRLVKITFDLILRTGVCFDYNIHIMFTSGKEVIITELDLINMEMEFEQRPVALKQNSSVVFYKLKNAVEKDGTVLLVHKADLQVMDTMIYKMYTIRATLVGVGCIIVIYLLNFFFYF